MLARDCEIYKEIGLLADLVFSITSKFRKDVKPSIGRRMEESVLELSKIVVRANTDIEHRVEILELDFVEEYESLQFLVNLAYRQRLIDDKKQANLARLMVGIGKQATGWKKSAQKRRKSNGSHII